MRTLKRVALLMPIALVPWLNGCAGSGDGPGLGARPDTYDRRWGVSSSARVVQAGPVPKGGGVYKLGRPYQIGGRWYVPRHEPAYDSTGVGSWYGHEFHGRKTANGELYDMSALTAAHPTLPMPSYAYVTNLRNGRTILVRINDRGPYVADRVIDLSRAAATALGYSQSGLGQVRVRWAGHAPLDGDDRREQEFLRSQPWNGGGGEAIARSFSPPIASPASSFAPPAEVTSEPRHTAAEQLPWQHRDGPRDRRGADYAYAGRSGVGSSYGNSAPAARSAAPPEEPPLEPERGPAGRPYETANQQWSPFAHREDVSASGPARRR